MIKTNVMLCNVYTVMQPCRWDNCISDPSGWRNLVFPKTATWGGRSVAFSSLGSWNFRLHWSKAPAEKMKLWWNSRTLCCFTGTWIDLITAALINKKKTIPHAHLHGCCSTRHHVWKLLLQNSGLLTFAPFCIPVCMKINAYYCKELNACLGGGGCKNGQTGTLWKRKHLVKAEDSICDGRTHSTRSYIHQ